MLLVFHDLEELTQLNYRFKSCLLCPGDNLNIENLIKESTNEVSELIMACLDAALAANVCD